MAEDDDDFDPDEFIQLPGEPELDEEAKAAIRAARAQEQAEFEQAARKGKFDDFHRPETPVREGTFHFRVGQRELLEVLAAVGLTVSKRYPRYACVKVVIFRTKLKICTFNQEGLTEYFLWLTEPSPDIPSDRAEEVAVPFIFDYVTLRRIVSKFPAVTIEFAYNAKQQTLALQTRNQFDPNTIQKDFLLSCVPLHDFTDYHAKLLPDPGPTLLGQAHAGLLRRAVEYAALFARKNDTQAQFSCATMYEGRLYAGTHNDMGAIGAPELQPLNFSVKFESIRPLGKMLAHLVAEDTSLWLYPDRWCPLPRL